MFRVPFMAWEKLHASSCTCNPRREVKFRRSVAKIVWNLGEMRDVSHATGTSGAARKE
jgi:hypothetical protein